MALDLSADDVYNAFFRVVWALLVAILALTLVVAQSRCPQISGATKQRLEQQARWLLSPSLQQQVAAKSLVFGALIKIEQCDFLTMTVMLDGNFATENLHFSVQNHAYKTLIGRNRDTWTLAVVPDDPSTKMPDANLLELTNDKWTLIRRDEDGMRKRVASGTY
jgi:hypothetical protein